MKYKVSELEGAQLDAAVAKAEGHRWVIERRISPGITWVGEVPLKCWVSGWKIPGPVEFQPSTFWADGGQLIERERISLLQEDLDYENGEYLRKGWWVAMLRPSAGQDGNIHGDFRQEGPTPLTAVMRAFVASELGEEVEL